MAASNPAHVNPGDSGNDCIPEQQRAIFYEYSSVSSSSVSRNSINQISSSVRAAMDALYVECYAKEDPRCLITHSRMSIDLAHVIQRESDPDEVVVPRPPALLQKLMYYLHS